MVDIREGTNLSAPRLSGLRLHTLLHVVADHACRTALTPFLHDPWQIQGSAEYYAHDLDIPLDLTDIPRCLVDLRHSGWLHQRPAHHGLATRLRRDDLELRFPDTMHTLRQPPAQLVGTTRTDTQRIETQLRQLSQRAR